MASSDGKDMVIEEKPFHALPEAQRDFYGELVRSVARAHTRGVSGNDVLSIVISALIEVAKAYGVTDMSRLVAGMRAAADFKTGGMG